MPHYMLVAQAGVDASAIGSVSGFAEKFGFPALLVLALLYGIYRMRQEERTDREKRDEREDAKEKARREEREADRKAHVDALGQNTASLGSLGAIVQRVEAKVDSLTGDVKEELLKVIK